MRKAVRQRLAEVRDRPERSTRLCAAIAASGEWARASCVAMFAAMKSEPDIELLWRMAAGKALVYPAISGAELHFAVVHDAAALTPGVMGIRQPSPKAERVSLCRIDLIIVPGIAFTRAGERLGHGGGFYDRLFAAPDLHAHRIGVCFDCQLFEALPLEPHDQRVECVVTESGFQRVG